MAKKKPLTRDEKQWLSQMQTLLAACPSSRLGFYTVDSGVTVFDRDARDRWCETNGCPATNISEDLAKSDSALNITLTYPALRKIVWNLPTLRKNSPTNWTPNMTKKKPLTREEKQWLSQMQALLSDPPSNRLGFFTIGDRGVTVFDRDVRDRWYEANGCPATDISEEITKSGADLNTTLTFPSIVESRAG